MNIKYFLSLLVIIFISFIIYQLYNSYENRKILKDSLSFNVAKNTESIDDYENIINELSSKNNIYGFLATIDKIKTNIKKNNLDEAYNGYLKLLNQNKYKEPFNSAIAIQGSYLFLNLLSKIESKLELNDKEKLTLYINTLLTFTDTKLEAYTGFKLEILYLLSILEQENSVNSNQSEKLYNQIVDNEKISSILKERVKKIHEFQKYK